MVSEEEEQLRIITYLVFSLKSIDLLHIYQPIALGDMQVLYRHLSFQLSQYLTSNSNS